MMDWQNIDQEFQSKHKCLNHELDKYYFIFSGDQLLSTLYISSTMFYIQEVPNKDGWGNNYEYLYSGNPLTAQVMAIFSPGRSPGSIGGSYTMGPFLATDYDQDIVWADGFFVRYPAGAKID